MGAVRRILALPEEILFFGRIGAYGVGIGVVYWFLTYEVAGSVLLIGFGVATGLLAVLLLFGRPKTDRRGDRDRQPGAGVTGDGPFADESGRIPAPSMAPLEFGFGLALASLALVFGAPMAVAAVLPLAAGGMSWLRSASAEWRAIDRDDRPRSSAP